MVKRFVAASLLPCVLAGCLTTDVARRAVRGTEGPELAVSVYASPGAADDHRPYPGRVRTRLLRLDGAATSVVHESDQAEWRLPAPAPGRYRLQVIEWDRADGRTHRRASPASETFRIGAGESVRLDVLLSDRRGLLWTLVGLGGVGLVVFLASHTK